MMTAHVLFPDKHTPVLQPMIQYLNKKDIYGPFHKRTEVYLPHSAEVTSAKYTNM